MSTSTTSQVPFPALCALNTEHLAHPDLQSQNPSSTCSNDTGHITYVPGDPNVNLFPAEDNTSPAKVNTYLSSQLETRLLDELYDRMWLVARKSGHSIDALHMQKIKGRDIAPCEDPRLHLVWQGDKIYIKPLPVCLLNHEFWTRYLHLPESKELHASSSSSDSVTSNFDRSVAVGFLRSYAFLIRHHLDFVIAKESHLIPNDVDWINWSKFINHFRSLGDDHVAKRYHYGQLRLSRLNWVVRLFRPWHASTWWFYEIPHWSITEYITRATIPLLFLFATISLALSSMQVVLSVPTDRLWFMRPDESGLRYMSRAFWVFSVSVLLLSGVIWILLIGIPLVVLAWQLSWGFRERKKDVQVASSSSV
jgi:hypothetical protein